MKRVSISLMLIVMCLWFSACGTTQTAPESPESPGWPEPPPATSSCNCEQKTFVERLTTSNWDKYLTISFVWDGPERTHRVTIKTKSAEHRYVNCYIVFKVYNTSTGGNFEGYYTANLNDNGFAYLRIPYWKHSITEVDGEIGRIISNI